MIPGRQKFELVPGDIKIFTCQKLGQFRCRQLTKMERILVEKSKMSNQMDDCYLQDWHRFRLSEILKKHDTKSTFPEPENASEKHWNSKANLVIFSENPRKSMNSPLNSNGFWEAFCDFDFLLIAQVKLDILHVQNEVEQTLDSWPKWEGF